MPCEAWRSLSLFCLYLSLAFRVGTRSLGMAGGVVAILCSVLMPYEDKVEVQFGKLYVSYLGTSGIREGTTNFGECAEVHHFPLEVDGVKAVEQVSKLSLYDDKAEEHSALLNLPPLVCKGKASEKFGKLLLFGAMVDVQFVALVGFYACTTTFGMFESFGSLTYGLLLCYEVKTEEQFGKPVLYGDKAEEHYAITYRPLSVYGGKTEEQYRKLPLFGD